MNDPSSSGFSPEEADQTPALADTPCLQIQMDLSAMLDGELEPASVRRVLVHSDVCPACRSFLDGIRGQMRAHRELAEFEFAEGDAKEFDPAHEVVRRQLLENRTQLARILYELGRSHILLGTSPEFSREVAAEPVPIPDMLQRCRAVLAEVRELRHEDGTAWVPAQELFDGDALREPEAAMAKGKRLVREALALVPDFFEARIYLGHAYHVCGERFLARREFERVLSDATDPVTRAFALVNLGTVHLEDGVPQRAVPYLLELVDSGAVQREPRFFTAYFNLALAFGLMERFEDAETWLSRLWDEFPHKRRLVGEELAKRARFAALVRGRSTLEAAWARRFAEWFPLVQSEVA